MRIYVAPTDPQWADYLRGRADLDEVNFWWPSGYPLKVLQPGDVLFFKSKAAAGNRLIGGGWVSGWNTQTVSEAWRFFGQGNGQPTRELLLDSINRYRDTKGQARDTDPRIGCVLLHSVFFAQPEAELPPPPGYATSLVRGRGYTDDDHEWSYVENALQRLLTATGPPPVDLRIDLSHAVEGATRGESRLIVPRRGQQAFKSLVLTSYDRRCAITGGKITPALEAAHIRPVEHDGQHRVDNGLLLRSDVHRMFDAGYLGVDERHRLQVSPRLRTDFGNGAEFYNRIGERIHVPSNAADRPSKDAVTWHMDTVFLR